MSSRTFDRFLKQLYAEGGEKADGFDLSHFDGLTLDERLEAARLLRDALLRGDDTAAHGLVLLDPQAARATLEETLQKYSEDAYGSLTLAGELWSLTRDLRYQDLMIACLKHPNSTIRLRALVMLRDTPHGDKLMSELQSLVMDDPDETIRFWAAIHLLYGFGLITDFHKREHPYKQIVRDLSDESREVRQKALAELKSQNLPSRN